MPKLEHMTEVMRKQALFFPCMEFPDNPWTEMRKPLSKCKVGLVTSAGLHLRGDKPFIGDHEKRDHSFRVIPSSARAADIGQSHTSIGFDRTGIYKEINVAFPIDRLRELAEQGVIGGVAKNLYSFMGAVTYPNQMMAKTGPEAARLMKEEGVDVVLLTPV
jgi:D-proline reductase (dithiol) PrdB